MSGNRRTWQTFEEMRAAAEEGDVQAQCYLGVCFQNGQGVAQDYQEAVIDLSHAKYQNMSTMYDFNQFSNAIINMMLSSILSLNMTANPIRIPTPLLTYLPNEPSLTCPTRTTSIRRRFSGLESS